jgi:hypothetical protein
VSKPQDKGRNIKYKKTYTIRDVVKDAYKDRIEQCVSKLSGNTKAGSGPWLRHYLAAVSYVVANLSKKERTDAVESAAEWESVGPLDSIKAA